MQFNIEYSILTISSKININHIMIKTFALTKISNAKYALCLTAHVLRQHLNADKEAFCTEAFDYAKCLLKDNEAEIRKEKGFWASIALYNIHESLIKGYINKQTIDNIEQFNSAKQEEKKEVLLQQYIDLIDIIQNTLLPLKITIDEETLKYISNAETLEQYILHDSCTYDKVTLSFNEDLMSKLNAMQIAKENNSKSVDVYLEMDKDADIFYDADLEMDKDGDIFHDAKDAIDIDVAEKPITDSKQNKQGLVPLLNPEIDKNMVKPEAQTLKTVKDIFTLFNDSISQDGFRKDFKKSYINNNSDKLYNLLLLYKDRSSGKIPEVKQKILLQDPTFIERVLSYFFTSYVQLVQTKKQLHLLTEKTLS